MSEKKREYKRIYGDRIDFQYQSRHLCKDNTPNDTITKKEVDGKLKKSMDYFNYQGSLIGNAICIIAKEIRNDRIKNIDESIGIKRRDRTPRSYRIFFWTKRGTSQDKKPKGGTRSHRSTHGKFRSETYCVSKARYEYLGL